MKLAMYAGILNQSKSTLLDNTRHLNSLELKKNLKMLKTLSNSKK